MLKQILVFCLVFTLLLALCGCSTKDPASLPEGVVANTDFYIITEENGQCILRFKDKYIDSAAQEDSISAMSVSLRFPTFDNLKEMKAAILNGRFDYDGLNALYRSAGEDRELNVVDPRNLQTLLLPEGSMQTGVVFYGSHYNISIQGSDLGTAVVQVYQDAEQVEKHYNERFTAWMPTQTVYSITTEKDRGATVYHHSSKAAEFRTYYYELSVPNGVMYIEELYMIDYFNKEHDRAKLVSDIKPRSINIYCVTQDGGFYTGLDHLESRPSVEWLSSFGLTPYVEE